MGTEPLRQPAVAGRFYSGTDEGLRSEVEGYLAAGPEPEKAIGAVVPHAGLMYSGAVAGETVSAIKVPSRVLLLGPNHTGLGAGVSVYPGGTWRMPFGDIPVDGLLAERIIGESDLPVADELAHLREHSLEVILPFLHYARGAPFSFVPVALSQLSRDECRNLGQSLARVIRREAEDILIVSSSDMTHYESHEAAREKDMDAVSRILAMDPDGLFDVVRSRRITMCGIIPTTVMLYAATALGATAAKLIRYATSGDVSGDYSQVVGYAGVIVQ